MNTFFYDDDEIRRKNRIHFCYLFVLEGLSKSDDNHWSFDEEGQFFNVYNVFKMKKRKKMSQVQLCMKRQNWVQTKKVMVSIL